MPSLKIWTVSILYSLCVCVVFLFCFYFVCMFGRMVFLLFWVFCFYIFFNSDTQNDHQQTKMSYPGLASNNSIHTPIPKVLSYSVQRYFRYFERWSIIHVCTCMNIDIFASIQFLQHSQFSTHNNIEDKKISYYHIFFQFRYTEKMLRFGIACKLRARDSQYKIHVLRALSRRNVFFTIQGRK